MRRVVLTLGSSRVRLALGLVLACLLLTQIISTFGGNRLTASTVSSSVAADLNAEVEGRGLQEMVKLAKTDHVTLLKGMLDHYNRTYSDYTCTLTKQERLAGKMSETQILDIKFKEDPFAVMMTWRVNPARGDKMLYVENDPAGQHKMFVHPSGALGLAFRSVPLSPDDPEVRASSLRSIREFGFARGMQSLIDVYAKAKAAGHLLEESYTGVGEVDGRPTFVLRRVLEPGHNYPAYLTIIEIDQEYQVPVHVKGLDKYNVPICDYVYSNIKLNVGLKNDDFTKAANGL